MERDVLIKNKINNILSSNKRGIDLLYEIHHLRKEEIEYIFYDYVRLEKVIKKYISSDSLILKNENSFNLLESYYYDLSIILKNYKLTISPNYFLIMDIENIIHISNELEAKNNNSLLKVYLNSIPNYKNNNDLSFSVRENHQKNIMAIIEFFNFIVNIYSYEKLDKDYLQKLKVIKGIERF